MVIQNNNSTFQKEKCGNQNEKPKTGRLVSCRNSRVESRVAGRECDFLIQPSCRLWGRSQERTKVPHFSHPSSYAASTNPEDS